MALGIKTLKKDKHAFLILAMVYKSSLLMELAKIVQQVLRLLQMEKNVIPLLHANSIKKLKKDCAKIFVVNQIASILVLKDKMSALHSRMQAQLKL